MLLLCSVAGSLLLCLGAAQLGESTPYIDTHKFLLREGERKEFYKKDLAKNKNKLEQLGSDQTVFFVGFKGRSRSGCWKTLFGNWSFLDGL